MEGYSSRSRSESIPDSITAGTILQTMGHLATERPPYMLVKPDEGENFHKNTYRNRRVTPLRKAALRQQFSMCGEEHLDILFQVADRFHPSSSKSSGSTTQVNIFGPDYH